MRLTLYRNSRLSFPHNCGLYAARRIGEGVRASRVIYTFIFIEMSRQHHHLKTETEYYQQLEAGVKRFELRKNDRNFQKGDYLHLEETVNGQYTGRALHMEVKYILHGGKFGLEEGYCIMQL